MSRPVDPLVVALIRSLNASRIGDETDEALVAAFGQAAQPLADGLRVAIRDEVTRQLEARDLRARAAAHRGDGFHDAARVLEARAREVEGS